MTRDGATKMKRENRLIIMKGKLSENKANGDILEPAPQRTISHSVP